MGWTIVPRGKEPSQNLEVMCSLPRNPAARALVLVCPGKARGQGVWKV